MYLDPSFGGMLIQIIIAIVVAGGALAFGMRKKIAAAIKKIRSKNGDGEIAVETIPAAVDAADVVDVLDETDVAQTVNG